MSASRPSRGGLGGLGAIFFLGTLGAIAFYVQQQAIPEERDVVRKSATVVAEEAEPDQPRALPWQDRLDLSAVTLVPFHGTAAAGVKSAAPGSEAPPDPASGRLVQSLNDGHRILLTLDPVLQDAALQIFRNREVPYAAAVVLDLQDNSVLAFAGHSSLDPEVDPLEILTTAWAPAASTFKLVTAATLLEEERATPTTKVCFNGGLHDIADDRLRDDPVRDTQCATLSEAVAHSYNLVIGKLALKHLEIEPLVGMAKKLRFDSEIPFEFTIEPSPIHLPKDAVERAKVAAGFWNVDLSPVHAALLASIFAREGMYQPPHVIAQVLGPDGSDMTPSVREPQRVLSKTIAREIGKMMVGTTTSGTARMSFRDDQGADFIPGIVVAAKTGSLTGKRAPALNYNWFIGYAPAEAPEMAFAVILANGPKWRIKAHYAGRRLIQIWLQRREDIIRQRGARLGPDGLLAPQHDPALAASAASGSEPPKASPSTPREERPAELASSPAAPVHSGPADALPPVPGPLPKPTGGT